jgi:NAD(P)H-dependent FMN reductase
MKLLAITGSLRLGSSNTALLEAAALIGGEAIAVHLYDGLATLPAFNPDQDTMEGGLLPPEPARLRALVGEADGVLISSPEYAHGIPGSLKNLLDWLVGSFEFPGKPVALLRPSDRSRHAHAQLVEVLTTMSATLVEDASRVVLLPTRSMIAAEVAADPALAGALGEALDAMKQAIQSSTSALAPSP